MVRFWHKADTGVEQLKMDQRLVWSALKLCKAPAPDPVADQLNSAVGFDRRSG